MDGPASRHDLGLDLRGLASHCPSEPLQKLPHRSGFMQVQAKAQLLPTHPPTSQQFQRIATGCLPDSRTGGMDSSGMRQHREESNLAVDTTYRRSESVRNSMFLQDM